MIDVEKQKYSTFVPGIHTCFCNIHIYKYNSQACERDSTTALQEDPVLQTAHQDTHEIGKNAKLHMVLPIH